MPPKGDSLMLSERLKVPVCDGERPQTSSLRGKSGLSGQHASWPSRIYASELLCSI